MKGAEAGKILFMRHFVIKRLKEKLKKKKLDFLKLNFLDVFLAPNYSILLIASKCIPQVIHHSTRL